MNFSKYFIIVGLVVLGLGLTFHFQGRGVIGPDTSFMYSNPDWINHGVLIAIIGVFVMGIGIAVGIKKINR